MPSNHSKLVSLVQVLVATLLMPTLAFASTTGGGPGLLWESSFETILQSVQAIGATLLVVGIVITGVKLANSEGGGVGGKAVGLILGGGLVLGATTFVDVVFAGASGLPL
jgi:type IV secretory pathway VirB2 component (pilin)